MKNVIQIGFLFASVGLLGCGRGVEEGDHGSHGSEPTTAGDQQANETPGEHAPEAAGEPVGTEQVKGANDWSDGDTIPSGKVGVPDIKILKVHGNGTGDACGIGKTATLAYKAMTADGTVIDPGTRPFSFQVGAGRSIPGFVPEQCLAPYVWHRMSPIYQGEGA
tara:strand:+ start:257 stop:748 length:492 start_codon:yes stop_codon:yes gene_type:complete